MNRRRRPIAPIVAATLVHLLVAAVGLVLVVRGDALGSVILLAATAGAWQFSRWYQRRYPE